MKRRNKVHAGGRRSDRSAERGRTKIGRASMNRLQKVDRKLQLNKMVERELDREMKEQSP